MLNNNELDEGKQFDENAYFMENKIIYGRHATIIKKLKEDKIFKTNREVYILSPIIGFLYHVKSKEDKEPSLSLGRADETKVFAAELTRDGEWKKLKFTYQLIMPLDKGYTPDYNNRADKAFRNVLRNQEDKLLFESYIRGGIDKLNDKIYSNGALHATDFMDNILDFMEEFEKLVKDSSEL